MKEETNKKKKAKTIASDINIVPVKLVLMSGTESEALFNLWQQLLINKFI